MEDIDNIEEDDFGFSRNYFLAKELGGSSKRSARKLSDINIVDEQVILGYWLPNICLLWNIYFVWQVDCVSGA